MDSIPAERRLAIVANELEAHMMCSVLEEQGIRCLHRRTAAAGLDWGSINVGAAGAREIVVMERDLPAAHAAIAAMSVDESDAAPSSASAQGDAAQDARQRASARRVHRYFALFVLVAFGLPLAVALVLQVLGILGSGPQFG